MTSWYLVGDFDCAVFLLRDPKSVSIGVREIHIRTRGICPRCSLGVRSKFSSTLGLDPVLVAS